MGIAKKIDGLPNRTCKCGVVMEIGGSNGETWECPECRQEYCRVSWLEDRVIALTEEVEELREAKATDEALLDFVGEVLSRKFQEEDMSSHGGMF